MDTRWTLAECEPDRNDGVMALNRVLRTMPAQARLRLAAQIVEDVAYDQAGLVDHDLVGDLIGLAACLGSAGRRH